MTFRCRNVTVAITGRCYWKRRTESDNFGMDRKFSRGKEGLRGSSLLEGKGPEVSVLIGYDRLRYTVPASRDLSSETVRQIRHPERIFLGNPS